MDNFMDKLAQRFNAQEMIKANSQAEAQEIGRLREQLKAYEDCLQDMRRLNLKNVEVADKTQHLTAQMSELTAQAIHAIEESRGKENEKLEAALTAMQEAVALVKNEMEESGKLSAENQEKLLAVSESFGASSEKVEEFVHKECVKVYRNVQAVLLEELKNQTKELEEKLEQSQKGKKWLYVLLVLTLLAGLGNLGILIAQLMGVM